MSVFSILYTFKTLLIAPVGSGVMEHIKNLLSHVVTLLNSSLIHS